MVVAEEVEEGQGHSLVARKKLQETLVVRLLRRVDHAGWKKQEQKVCV